MNQNIINNPMEANTLVSNYLFQQQAFTQLRDALAVIPQQQAYREALLRCPNLVQTESHPMQFLVYAGYNAWNAAERLVMYWQKRKEIFGEKAFLPILDLSGNGALTMDDVNLIKTGSFLFTAEDTVVIDRGLEPVDVNFSIESQIRRGFFFFQLLASSRITASPGKGCRFVFRVKRYKTLDQRVPSKVTDFLKNAFPIRIKAIHLVFAADFQLGFIQNVASSLCKQWDLPSNYLLIHHCKTPELALIELVAHGILPVALPPSLGGTYKPSVEFIRFLTQMGFSMTLQNMNNIWTGHDPIPIESLSSRAERTTISATSENDMKSETDSSMGEVADVISRGLQGLDEAIQLLPDEDKSAYLQALQQAPELVELESTPLVFLRYENFDTWAAATRLCNYWKDRVQIFEERAFLPMTLDGAMGPDGEKALDTGMYYLLEDENTSRMVWCAESLLKMSSDPEMDFKMRAKMYYYVTCKMLKQPKSLRDDMIGIMLIREIQIPIIDWRWRANRMRCAKLVKDSFPFGLSTMQVICNPSGGTILSTIVLNFFLRIIGSFFGDLQNIHICTNTESQEQVYQKFEAMGVPRKILAKALNGKDAASEFVYRQRMEESQVRSPGVSKVAKSAIYEMRSALSEIEHSKKGAYLEAVRKAPDIAEQESLLESFLRFTRGDARKAAAMFVKYWEMRKDIFSDRAFLPMNQTFEGTLERKDVAVLQMGYVIQLPCVQGGNSVLYCDGTKLQKSSSAISRARCKFYMLSIMAENPVSQTRGFNLLYFLSDPSFDRAFKECFLEKILPVMPVRVQHVHILGLNLGPANTDNVSVETRLAETKLILNPQRTMGLSLVDAHVGTSREDLFKGLLRHGFSKEGLPKTVCGALGFEDFVKWQELRVRYEWGLFTNSKEQEISSTYLIPRNKLTLHEEESEKIERKRRMTIILSRRKRERERMALEELQEEAMELSERHRKLKRQNDMLHQLVEDAKTIVRDQVSA